MFQSKWRKNKLRFESLERRAMLAGDVDVSLSGAGTLRIAGDADDNDVSITQDLVTGDYTVTGNGTTTLNNGGIIPLVFLAADVVNIDVKLKAGDDILHVDANVVGFLKISMGGGLDTVVLGEAGAMSVGGDLDVHTGLDDDSITADGLTVAGKADFDMSDGDDTLDVATSTFGGNVRIGLGHGIDTLTLATVTVAGNLDLHTGTGDDTATITDLSVTGPSAVIDTSDGIDTVSIADSDFLALEVRLGLGDDSLTILATTVTGLANLKGSAGIDTFTNDAANVFGTLVTNKIENLL